MGSQLEYFDGVSHLWAFGAHCRLLPAMNQLNQVDHCQSRFYDWDIYNLGWSKVYIYFSAIFSFLVNLAPSNHGFVITRPASPHK
jgi:hypothetical protein